MIWHLGNTTVRTPYRLRSALIALQDSPLNGSLIGKEQEQAFAALLHDQGILHASRDFDNDDVSDLGRKWRAALSQLGFITPKLTRNTESGHIDVALSEFTDIDQGTGKPFEITPNGYRLIQAELVTAQQECFLRSLASYRLPSVLETTLKIPCFSPLRFVLKVISEVALKYPKEPRLSMQEFALFVQTSSPTNGIDSVVAKVLEFREGRNAAAGKVRQYDREKYESISTEIGKAYGTLNDYADTSFRYLKATGLVKESGRGISLSAPRAKLAKILSDEELETLDKSQYLRSLWEGASLPTDDVATAYEVILDLASQIEARGETLTLLPASAEIQDLQALRLLLEDRVQKFAEEDYAADQANCIPEIESWLSIIPSRGKTTLENGEKIAIPQGEGPAYLEWVIWRAFLAINSLKNKPWDARRFQIDQDFMPINCAPGGGPDMIFEFEDFLLVVEVTLTASSRQEAAEGEPVRRHVAQYAENSSKAVYGFFIAVQIDSNTAHTFRAGDWYLRDDSKITLDIVPMILADFGKFFVSGTGRLRDMPNILQMLLIECRAKANQDAPQWKREISRIVEKKATI